MKARIRFIEIEADGLTAELVGQVFAALEPAIDRKAAAALTEEPPAPAALAAPALPAPPVPRAEPNGHARPKAPAPAPAAKPTRRGGDPMPKPKGGAKLAYADLTPGQLKLVADAIAADDRPGELGRKLGCHALRAAKLMREHRGKKAGPKRTQREEDEAEDAKEPWPGDDED